MVDPVRLATRLNAPGCTLGSARHDNRVPAFECLDEPLAARRCLLHLARVGDDAPCAQHVLSVGRSIGRDFAVDHDIDGLFDLELRSLDEV